MSEVLSDAATGIVLKARNLKKRFRDFRAVDGLNLTVPEGKIYGFLGRNGAGKTTTIRMLMGIIESDGGEIEMLGKPTHRLTLQQKQSIGYLSQGQFFYPWMTCREIGNFVAGFYPAWDEAEFKRLLQALDLPPKRKISALSHGMKVKLALALALAHRPTLLILDEPTAGLDPVARREFLEIVQQQSRTHHRTTFFSSHLIDEVERIADVVGIIDRGQLRYEGDIASLQESVRRIPSSAKNGKTPLGDGFYVLKEEFQNGPSCIVCASAEDWSKLPADCVSQPLSLEDIFIALTWSAPARL